MCALPKRQGKISVFASSSSSSPASLVISNVDLLCEILLRLPYQSTIAFKSVSKQWRSIISHSSFQKSLLNKHSLSLSGCILPNSICLTNKEYESEYIFYDKDCTRRIPFKFQSFGKNKSGIKIDQSCNGLLLCSSFVSITSDSKRKYYVYNPYTKQYKLIPGRRSFCYPDSVGLAFDPSKSPHYKVVTLKKTRSDYGINYQIDVYSSETNSWKDCVDNFCTDTLDIYHRVYWNGCLNWHGINGTLYYFGVDNERMKQVEPPPTRKGVQHLDVCNGCLWMISHYFRTCTTLNIFEMDTDYTRWNTKYRFSMLPLIRLYGYGFEYKATFYDESHLQEAESSPKLLFWIKIDMVHQVTSFDLKSKVWKRIYNLDQPCDFLAQSCRKMDACLHKLVPSLANV